MSTELKDAPEASAPETPARAPFIGASVHLWGPGERPLTAAKAPYAAIVVHVQDSGNVNLAMFNTAGVCLRRMNIPYSANPKTGHWTWPKKEK